MTEQIEIKKTICMGCHCRCRLGVHVENGRLLKVEEDLDHPLGELQFRPTVRACPRMRAAAELFHHPDRLNYPLKRLGERGEGKWQTISWEQALDEIAERLKAIKERYGAEALALTKGTYRTHEDIATRFFNLFGSPNIVGGACNICWCDANMVSGALMGWRLNMPFIILPGVTKCLLLMGVNWDQAHRRWWFPMLAAQKAGAKLIVIDPRRTREAERADIWLQPRPGTDTALLMSMINVIIEEGLYDKEFVGKWCHGFDKLAERAREYAPEKAAEITWVPAEKIRAAARMYATNKPAASDHMMGLEQLPNGGQALHARFILPAITGNIGVIGGDILTGPYPELVSDYELELNDKLSPEQMAKKLGDDRAGLFSWAAYESIRENAKKVWPAMWSRLEHCTALAQIMLRAIITGKPYPVKGVITVANNPLVTWPNTKLVYKAIKALDLYVVMDHWMTPSAELADYVLPAASFFERPHIETAHGILALVEVGEAALPPQVEGERDRRMEYDFWRGLGIRLGQADYWPWNNLEELYDYRLAPLGYTLKSFLKEKAGFDASPTMGGERNYEKTGFGTPTGKVELYSTIMEKLGLDPLPRYEEPPESPVSDPELAKEYPLILITGGRHQPYYHSEHRQIDSLRRQHPDPLVQINPQKAAELGIENGDWVWIETPRGRIRQKAQLFDGIDPRVIHAQHGWWFPELPGEEPWLHGVWESNINVLTDDDPDNCNKVTGGWPLRALLCKAYKVKRY